jgi:predicted GIY-YIG superfamily endonuclease
MSAEEGVYVLELNDPGYYYVGQSRCISRRIQQHRDGEGSHFCLAQARAVGAGRDGALDAAQGV